MNHADLKPSNITTSDRRGSLAHRVSSLLTCGDSSPRPHTILTTSHAAPTPFMNNPDRTTIRTSVNPFVGAADTCDEDGASHNDSSPVLTAKSRSSSPRPSLCIDCPAYGAVVPPFVRSCYNQGPQCLIGKIEKFAEVYL